MSAVRTAMVLAAGLGTRMRAFSDTIPKPLVPLAGKPLIDHVLDRLAAAGVERAVVNVHYLADQIEAHLEGRAAPLIEISDEREELLETGGGVAKALPELGDGPFFVHNSDSVWIEGPVPSLERMARAWDPNRMDTLMLLAPVSNTLGYEGSGDFRMDTEGRVTRGEEGEALPFVFAGVSIADARLFDGCPQGKFSLNVQWNRAIAAGRAYGVSHEGVWMHVGTPEAAREAEERMARETG